MVHFRVHSLVTNSNYSGPEVASFISSVFPVKKTEEQGGKKETAALIFHLNRPSASYNPSIDFNRIALLIDQFLDNGYDLLSAREAELIFRKK